jgi:outer membrane autotransporter protein
MDGLLPPAKPIPVVVANQNFVLRNNARTIRAMIRSVAPEGGSTIGSNGAGRGWVGPWYTTAKDRVIRAKTTGAMVGYDLSVDGNHRLGVLFGVGNSRISHRERIARDSGRQTLYAFGAYGSCDVSRLAVEWSSVLASATIHSRESLRAIGVDGAIPVHARYRVLAWFNGLSFKLPCEVGDFTLAPTFSLTLDHIKQKAHGYRVDGVEVVHYSKNGSTYFSGEAGIHCSTEKFAATGFRPYVFVGYEFDITGAKDGRRPNRCAPGYSVPSMPRTRMNAVSVRGGAGFGVSPNSKLTISYDGHLAKRSKSHGVFVDLCHCF